MSKLRFMGGMSRFALIATAVGFTILSLCCPVTVLVSSLKPSKGNLNHLSFAVIDSSQVATTVQGTTYHGLPDTNDFSTFKDFYAFYLWNYCSGKLHDGNYLVDFCSQPRQSLYDLFRYWKLWGASIHKQGTRFYRLEKGPKLLYVSYVVTASITALAFAAGIPALFTHRVSRVTLILSALSSACILTTSILAQVTYGQLIDRADDEDIPLQGRKVGQLPYVANWVGMVCSLVALAMWLHLLSTATLRRVATIDTSSYVPVKATGVDSPVESQSPGTPVRKRTMSKW